ncbi:MAG: tripartite tricarboxylate transporter permease [Beijerinckiaceae bacterium]|nr:tripartite tricarboxylate transporter permease [Beijerinckiaceae bacterium]
MLEAFFSGLFQVFTWPTLPLMLLGMGLGFAVGILPGLGGVVALAIMLPFTYSMEAVAAFGFLLGMLAVTGTTGDITSILFGIPGESVSAATIIDGHPMAKNGEAGRALGAALMSSLVGAVVGAFLLAAAIPIVKPLVLSFASPEFFALAMLGVAFIAAVSGAHVLKGLIAGGLGLMLSMVGLDPQSGLERFTFGSLEMWDGVSLVAITAGMFGIPEVIDLWREGSSISKRPVDKIGGVRQGVRDTFRYWSLTLRCSAIGTFAGIIPGLGASVGQWLAYAHAVQSSPDRQKFGRGDVRGVLGPGAANNSSLGGGLIPTIAFGVPGNVVFAILLGAFLIKGIVPGPELLKTNLPLVFSFVWIIVITNVITVGICFLFIKQLVRLTEIRGSLLIPTIIVFIFLGAYVDTKSWFAVALTLGAGAVGYVFVRFDWPRPPLVLGLVLGSLAEKNLFTSYQAYGAEMFLRPIVLVILVVGVSVIAWSAIQALLRTSETFSPVQAPRTSWAELPVALSIVGVAVYALMNSSRLPLSSRIFPWAIAIPLLALAIAQFALTLRNVLRSAGNASASGSEETIEPQAGAAAGGSLLAILLWISTFALLMVFVGFKIGGSLAALFFLRFAVAEKWRTAIALSLGTYVFFFLFGDVLKLVELDSGILGGTLGITTIESFIMQGMSR